MKKIPKISKQRGQVIGTTRHDKHKAPTASPIGSPLVAATTYERLLRYGITKKQRYFFWWHLYHKKK